MDDSSHRLVIRPFTDSDAEACFSIRREAYLGLFWDELGAEAAGAAIDAIGPGDFVSMADESDFFVAEEECEPIGFCVYRRVDDRTAELYLIYIKLDRLRMGIGSALMSFGESWLREYKPEVTDLIVDTVIPRYNQAFYEKHGFEKEGERPYTFLDKTVSAVRLRKRVR